MQCCLPNIRSSMTRQFRSCFHCLQVSLILGFASCARVRRLGHQSKAPPKLCDESIVKETCSLLRNPHATKEDVLYAARLSYHLQVHEHSVLNFLHAIGASNVEEDEAMLATGSFAVTCEDLCTRTIEHLPLWRRPPSSDVVCYHQPDFANVVCDMSIWDLPRFPDRTANDMQSMDPVHERIGSSGKSAKPGINPWVAVARKLEAAQQRPAKELAYLEVAVANLFRIYPPASITITRANNEDLAQSVQERQATKDARCSSVPDSIPAVGLHWRSGRSCKCPRDMIIAGGEDSCGLEVKDQRKFNPSSLQDKGCFCRRPSFKTQDCTDVAEAQCSSKQDRCHLPEVQDECPQTCGLKNCDDLLHGWEKNIYVASASAQAHVTKALRLMGENGGAEAMEFWLGSSSQAHREEVLRILNHLNKMLLTVEYRYGSSNCGKLTFGLVYPASSLSKNSRGQYVVYLCPLWMEVDLGLQVETITHEGSHHEPLQAHDMCKDGISHSLASPDCEKAYGRQNCRDLALSVPDGAIKNADSICYFINDLVKGKNEIYGPSQAIYDYVASLDKS